MKNKKSLLSLGLLALILVLGVGYAVVSNVTLEFGGTASVKEADLNVYIDSVVDTTRDPAVTHQIDKLKDTFTISEMKLNETVTMTYTIKNDETDVNATLSQKTALNWNNQDYFDVSYQIKDGDVEAKGTGTVKVTVTMKKTPVDTANSSTTVKVELLATPSEAAN